MVAVPQNPNTTLHAIDRVAESTQNCDFRDHLGASIIGDECSRKLWYEFRWVKLPGHTARILRLFARGNREEDVFIDLMRAANCDVWSVNPKTGKQWIMQWYGGHFGGSIDGIGKNLVESRVPHILEFKTHNDKSFKDVQKKGVKEAKPQHWAQMQIYMHGSKQLGGKQITRAYYLAVNKNDDQLYGERVKYDKGAAEELLQKAEKIIASATPPPRISDRPNWYLCAQCHFNAICHHGAVAFPSCRSCVHSTADIEIGGWDCITKLKTLKHADQLEACNEHLYIPELLTIGDLIDSDGKTYAIYIKDNKRFANVTGTIKSKLDVTSAYLSAELYGIDLKHIGDPGLDALRHDLNGTIIDANNR